MRILKLVKILPIVACLMLGAALFGCSQESDSYTHTDGLTPGLSIEISAPDWDAKTSTPCEIELLPSEGSEADLDVYSFENCNEPLVIDCEAGDYILKVVPPLNADGSIYWLPEEIRISADNFAESSEPLDIKLRLIDAENATAEDIEKALADYESALDKIDVQDMEKKETMALAKANAEANPNYRSAS